MSPHANVLQTTPVQGSKMRKLQCQHQGGQQLLALPGVKLLPTPGAQESCPPPVTQEVPSCPRCRCETPSGSAPQAPCPPRKQHHGTVVPQAPAGHPPISVSSPLPFPLSRPSAASSSQDRTTSSTCHKKHTRHTCSPHSAVTQVTPETEIPGERMSEPLRASLADTCHLQAAVAQGTEPDGLASALHDPVTSRYNSCLCSLSSRDTATDTHIRTASSGSLGTGSAPSRHCLSNETPETCANFALEKDQRKAACSTDRNKSTQRRITILEQAHGAPSRGTHVVVSPLPFQDAFGRCEPRTSSLLNDKSE